MFRLFMCGFLLDLCSFLARIYVFLNMIRREGNELKLELYWNNQQIWRSELLRITVVPSMQKSTSTASILTTSFVFGVKTIVTLFPRTGSCSVTFSSSDVWLKYEYIKEVYKLLISLSHWDYYSISSV
jgi:hypothetical protein